MTAEKETKTKRKTIGILSARLDRIWGAEFMSGVADAVEATDSNLVCFVGGKPIAIFTPGILKPSYSLYDLVTPFNVDGVILSADLAHEMSAEEMERFCERYDSIPKMAQAINASGLPSLMADSQRGMGAVIRHLIEKHGHRRIAFVRGPKGQIESELRYQAYRDELESHGIRLDERLVVDGDFSLESGRNAARILLEQSKARIDAIAASNDRMAFGVLEVLREAGVDVPGGIAVTGFDDVYEAQLQGVPLTTVHQDFYEAGKQSVETLLRLIDGKSINRQVVLPAYLVVRWSCGCLPESVQNVIVAPTEVARTAQLDNKRQAVIRALLGVVHLPQGSPLEDEFKAVFGVTWDSFLVTMREDKPGDDFLKSIDAMIGLMQKHDYDVFVWHNAISMLRRHALAGIHEDEKTLHAENLFQQARMLAGELSQRAQAYRRLVFEQREEMLQGLSSSMAPAMSLEGIGAAVARHFPQLGIDRWYVMFYSDVATPQSTLVPPSQSYRLLLQYEDGQFTMPPDQPYLATGQLIPRGKTPADRRYTTIVMPLTLASNRFGFMWTEVGPHDWDVYARVRNLLVSALLRTMLVEQREQAQREVEHLYDQVRQRAEDLAVAKENAEQIANENARLYQGEQQRREQAEALARAARQISSLSTMGDVPMQVLQQLGQVIPFERGSMLLEEPNGAVRVVAHSGFPDDPRVKDLRVEIDPDGVYDQISKTGEAVMLADVTRSKAWQQVEWLPINHSWLGVPLFSKNKVIGMLSMTRPEPAAFSQDDLLLASTFAMQAAISLENARLYDELQRFNEMMERMVAQRVEELRQAYDTLEKLDKNKTSFISVAAHELRTPLTVMKGYLGMLKGNPAIQADLSLAQVLDGVITGTDRLHSVINSMLDVARLENEVLNPHFESVMLLPLLHLVRKDYLEDLAERKLTLVIPDDEILALPRVRGDSQLLQKALDHIIVNAIKYTPDGGTISISGRATEDERRAPCVEIAIQDNGIGIDADNQKIIFEKLYSLGKVELHSSGRTKFKGGGPGLGLAIVQGIVKAHAGKIWVESPGYDEQKCPGSTFYLRLPVSPASS
jgi:signal transduction histidine kinase/DNA-binding LacI/PurR family transcriptional regulator